MIKRVFDLPLLLRSIEGTDFTPEDFKTWFDMPRNLMFADGENVGLATYEYPGVYSVHWFFKVRGRKALDLGRDMVKNLFENYGAETVRGFIKKDLKASRWAARQIGLRSRGFITFEDGEVSELFISTKEDFLNNLKEDKNG